MRVARERLIFISLAVLELARHRMRKEGPFRPGPEVRLALAVLFSFSRSGKRDSYDRFWRNLSASYDKTFSDAAGNTFRSNEAHTCLEGIVRDVGAPCETDFHARVCEFVYGPPKHPWHAGSGWSSSMEDASEPQAGRVDDIPSDR